MQRNNQQKPHQQWKQAGYFIPKYTNTNTHTNNNHDVGDDDDDNDNIFLFEFGDFCTFCTWNFVYLQSSIVSRKTLFTSLLVLLLAFFLLFMLLLLLYCKPIQQMLF